MREIKFRVWDKEPKRMEYLDNNNTHHSFTFIKGYAEYYNLQNGSGGDEYVLMQYTGLKDKNGKEIYDEDIVQSPVGTKGKVIWYEGGWNIFVNWEHKSQYFYLSTVNNEFQIIGNIYENPELIKE